MKDIGTFIYIAIILISIFGSLIGKKKKPKVYPTTSGKSNRPKSKSLDEILKEISESFDQSKPVVIPPSSKEIVQEEYQNEYTLESTNIVIEDTEEESVLTYDSMEDHRIHGKGFDKIFSEQNELSIKSESFKVDDWRKAIIYSEILKRPHY